MVLESALQEIAENGPNPTEFLLVNSSYQPEKTLDPTPYLNSWATAFSHRLREGTRQNPIQLLSRTEALSFIQERLERDIVFGTKGMDVSQAVPLASTIIESLGVVQAASISFPIEDWTFSDVLVAQGEKLVCVLGFLGED